MSFAFAIVLIAASAAAAFWVGYFRWKDRAHPEPLWLMLATVAGGASAVALAALGYEAFEQWGNEVMWSNLEGSWPGAMGAALAIGAIEEVAKALPVVVVAAASRNFDEWLDGAVYAGCSGIGFALAETGLHGFGGFTVAELWPRIVAAPMTHALFAAPFGVGIAAAVLVRRWWAAALGFGVSVLAHGSYDLALARSGAGAGVSAALVLVLWAAFLFAVPRLARREPVRRTGA